MNNKAFTLLELLIVIIIVGVLAGLAIPSYTKYIQSSYKAEALTFFSSIRQDMDGCYIMHNESYLNCNVLNIIVKNNDDDENENEDNNQSIKLGGHFNYILSNISKNQYKLTAKRNKLDKGDGISTIIFVINNGIITITKTGIFN